MLENATNIIQASLNPSSGEIKELPKPAAPKPAEAPSAPAQQPPEPAAASSAEPAAPAADPNLTKNFAALARKERDIRAHRMRLQKEGQEVAQLRAEAEKIRQQFSLFEQIRHKNPIEAAKMLGLSYEDMTNFQLSGGQQPTTEMEVKQLREKQEAFEKQYQAEKQEAEIRAKQAEQAQVQQTLQSFKRQVADFVQAKPDQYKLTNLEGEEAYNLIATTVERAFYKTKQLIPIEKAASLVEEYLKDDADRKWKVLHPEAPPTPAAKGDAAPTEVAPGFAAHSRMEKAASALAGPKPTLNNSMTSTTSPSLVSPKLENDRMSRALAALSK